MTNVTRLVDIATAGAEPPPGFSAQPFVLLPPEKIPMRDWLYGNLLCRRFMTADFAAGGTGKTSHAIGETLAMVSGKPLLGITPPRRLKVWFWNLEDPRDEIDRRIAAAAKHYGLTAADIDGHLFINHGRETPLVIAEITRAGVSVVRPVVENLVREIKGRGIDVIGVDPFVSSHKVTENDNNAIDAVVKEWGNVVEEGNCAGRLSHHIRKGEHEVTVQSGRGASALGDGVRIVRVFNRMTREEGSRAGIAEETYRRKYRTYIDKGNMAPPAERADWFELKSVDLPNGPLGTVGDSVGVSVCWEWPDPLAGVTGRDFDKAAGIIRGGTWRKNVQAKDWVGKAVAEAMGLDLNRPADKAKVKGIVASWIGAKSLVMVDGPGRGGHTVEYVRVAEDV